MCSVISHSVGAQAPPPRANTLLIGHAEAEHAAVDAMRSGRIHHAWLISGPEGIGKATFAYRFAKRLLVGSSFEETLALDPLNPVCRRVAASSHADLLTIERGFDPKRRRMRTQIAAEDVRHILPFMSLTPAEGGWRVVVVDGVDELNQTSANALLKILEEPPSRGVLLLICNTPGRLLPTIRSRCRHLRMAPLEQADMVELLGRYVPDLSVANRYRLIALAGGSPGRALTLAMEGGLAISALVEQVISDLPAIPPSRGYEISDMLGRSETGFSTFMNLLRTSLVCAIRDVACGQGEPKQERWVSQRPLKAWIEVWQALGKLQDETERFTLDKRHAVMASLNLLGA